MRNKGESTRVIELVDGGVGAPHSLDVIYDLPEDFESFYRRELTGLTVLARAMAGPAVAESIAQESMLAAYRRWDEICGSSSPLAWTRSVCMHKAVSVVRRRSMEHRMLRQLGSFRGRFAASDSVEALWLRVRRLPPRQAQAVALHYALDLPLGEVAAALGCSVATVEADLSDARAALARSWISGEED